ncbi:MAG: hypothetical protein AAGD96_02050 [Chloroflexota bacterium]
MILRYLEPKQFERLGNSSIYMLIGIAFFKRFVPTTGDLARRLWGITQLEYDRNSLANRLYLLELKTRSLEIRHWIGMLIFSIIAFVIKTDYSLFDYFFITILFLLVNVYPILLQRHNRIRILNLLESMGHPSPYRSTSNQDSR